MAEETKTNNTEKIANLETQAADARDKYSRKQEWASRALYDGSVFENTLQKAIMKDIGGLEKWEKDKAQAAADLGHIYDTDSADLYGLEDPNMRRNIWSQRASNKVADYSTASNVLGNIRGTVEDVVGSGVQAFMAKAQMAQNQADQYYRDWKDIIDENRYLTGMDIDQSRYADTRGDVTKENEWRQKMFDYQLERDKVADEQWLKSFNKAGRGGGGGGGGGSALPGKSYAQSWDMMMGGTQQTQGNNVTDDYIDMNQYKQAYMDAPNIQEFAKLQQAVKNNNIKVVK